jgi:phosphotransferase system HPr (HPr) family protein
LKLNYLEKNMVVFRKKVIVKNKLGLHARPAALFVQLANKFDSAITVRKGKHSVNGKSIMGILMLAAAKGAEIQIEADGKDAKEAVLELEGLVSKDE